MNASVASGCIDCPPGHYCRDEVKKGCKRGTYNPDTLSTSAAACYTCPSYSTTLAAASTPVDACLCDAGYYNENSSSVACAACPIGAVCTEIGVTIETLQLSPGYFRVSTHSVTLLRCGDADDLDQTACVGGSGAGEQLCKEWTTGPYCSLCNVTDGSRYYDDDSSACLECSGDVARAIVLLVVPLAAAILAALALIFAFRKRLRASRKCSLSPPSGLMVWR